MLKRTAICITAAVFFIFSGTAMAAEPDVYPSDVFNVGPGETFTVAVHVECHAPLSNYTVTVTKHSEFEYFEPASDMDITGDVASITYEGEDGTTLDFYFQMMASEEISEGDYTVPYSVSWNGPETGYSDAQVETGSVNVNVEESADQSACSTADTIIMPLLGIVTMFYIVKKQRR